MARPLRLALIMLLTGAGVVIAAPVVTSTGRVKSPGIEAPAKPVVHSEYVFHVDQKSGCVWRIAVESGRRNLDTLPCKRPKLKSRQAERSPADPQVTTSNGAAPAPSHGLPNGTKRH